MSDRRVGLTAFGLVLADFGMNLSFLFLIVSGEQAESWLRKMLPDISPPVAPGPTQQPQDPDEAPVAMVEVDRSGRVAVNGEVIGTLADTASVVERLRAVVGELPPGTLALHADKDVTLQTYVHLYPALEGRKVSLDAGEVR